MADEPRCPRSDLPVSMCAHCRGDVWEGLTADDLVGRPFAARDDGTCEGCDGRYFAGNRICRLADGGYACPRCIQDAA